MRRGRLAREFNLMGVLHEKAHGHTLLWEPERALDIYADTEPAFRTASLRDLGNFTILKAKAHAYAGNVDVGVRLGIEGLAFARRYDSPRHVSRVQRMYDRLGGTPSGPVLACVTWPRPSARRRSRP
jgi:hypothetical protein